MATKTLRILIADSCAVQRLMIEKMLNRLGYYGIAGTPSVREAWELNQYKFQAFDLLVINVRLLCHMLAPGLLCARTSNIQNLLVFGFHEQPVDRFAGMINHNVIEGVPGLPGYRQMENLMTDIEAGRRALSLAST